jgi:hypothetical protein
LRKKRRIEPDAARGRTRVVEHRDVLFASALVAKATAD